MDHEHLFARSERKAKALLPAIPSNPVMEVKQ